MATSCTRRPIRVSLMAGCEREGLSVAVGSRRVIAGVSGSLRSLGALRAGVAEARSSGAALLAVLTWAPAGGEYAYQRAPCPLLLRLWERAAQDRMREAFDAAFGGVPPDVAVRTLVVRARPGPLLVELADQPDDLLVVGCGRRSPLSRATHGSVTRYCLAHARCPVLAVPPPDLITELRPWHAHWRPEDFAVPLVGADQASRQRSGDEPAGGSANRAGTSLQQARADGAASSSDLPRAYQGAPYYQPSPPSRRARTLRQLRHATVLLAVLLLVVVIGMLLAHGSSLP
jgi:nucleotide-binding universal stress UspA family protein